MDKFIFTNRKLLFLLVFIPSFSYGSVIINPGGGVSSSSTTPGGSDTQVQYNSSGTFGGTSVLTVLGSTVSFNDIFNMTFIGMSSMTFESGTNLITSPGATLTLPASATPPVLDCDEDIERGRIYIDTNATTGQQVYVCEGTTGWVQQTISTLTFVNYSSASFSYLGISSAPAQPRYFQVSLTTGIVGTLPIANLTTAASTYLNIPGTGTILAPFGVQSTTGNFTGTVMLGTTTVKGSLISQGGSIYAYKSVGGTDGFFFADSAGVPAKNAGLTTIGTVPERLILIGGGDSGAVVAYGGLRGNGYLNSGEIGLSATADLSANPAIVLYSPSARIMAITDYSSNFAMFTSSWIGISTALPRMALEVNGGGIFASSLTVNGTLFISSSVHANGLVGVNGQVFTSGGPGAVPTWTTVSGSGSNIYPSTSAPIVPAIYIGSNTATLTSTITINGSFQRTYTALTANITLNSTHDILNCTSNTFTITLPTAVGIAGREYVIKNSGTGVITVATTSAQTIDGASTYTISTQYQSATVVSDGANWMVI